MSKIICDVCGASYDDAAGACPLCGWKPGEELSADMEDFDTDLLDAALADTPAVTAPTAPTKAKPVFDFEAANSKRPDAPKKPPVPVKKDDDEEDDDEDEDEEEEKSGTNIFLVILLILLILALLAVSGWLLYTKVLNRGTDTPPAETTSSQTSVNNMSSGSDVLVTPGIGGTGTASDPVSSEVVPTTAVNAEPLVPCTNLTLVGTMDKLTFAGQYSRLMVRSEPSDTTDTIVYESGDENVVTIDEFGRVMAVGEGTTTIVVTCGTQRLETTAVVDFGGASTSATTAPAAGGNGAAAGTPAAGTSSNNGTLKIMYHGKAQSDFTIGRRGVYISLELDGIPVESATWRTSDSSVATVNNGNVTAMGKGQCVVTVTYNGQTAEATIRCKW